MLETSGVLMLYAGPQVAREPGTWALYFISHSPGQPFFQALQPTYGTLEDVEIWLREDYGVSPEVIIDLIGKVASNGKDQSFMFNTFKKII